MPGSSAVTTSVSSVPSADQTAPALRRAAAYAFSAAAPLSVPQATEGLGGGQERVRRRAGPGRRHLGELGVLQLDDPHRIRLVGGLLGVAGERVRPVDDRTQFLPRLALRLGDVLVERVGKGVDAARPVGPVAPFSCTVVVGHVGDRRLAEVGAVLDQIQRLGLRGESGDQRGSTFATVYAAGTSRSFFFSSYWITRPSP